MSSELCGRRASVAAGLLVVVAWGVTTGVHGQPSTPPTSSAEALRIYEGAANAQNQKAYELAAEEWAEFLTRFPRDPLAAKARYYEGICHLQLRRWDAAVSSFSSVVREFPRFELLEDALLNLGWSQFSLAEQGEKERFAPAIETFTQALEKFPDGKRRDEALFFRGESLYALERRQEAVASYRELVQHHPESRLRCDALYALGVALEELADFNAAGRAYDQLLADCPRHELITEVRMRKAETLLQTNYVEAADQLFGEVAASEDFPAADHALVRQAVCRAKQEKYAESGELYGQAVTRFPESPLAAEAEVSAARAFYRAQDFDDARTWLNAVIRRDGEAALEAVHWLSRIHLREGKVSEAEQLLQAYRERAVGDPWEPELLVDLADSLYEQPARREEAYILYRDVAERFSDHRQAPQALYNAAFAALELRRIETCMELTARLLAEYPEEPLVPDTLLLAVEANLEKRDFAAAERHLRHLLADYPNRPERTNWQVRLGLVLYVAGEYERALEHLRGTLSVLEQPDHVAEAQYLVGACCYFRGEFAESRSALEASLQASSTWRQADEATLLLARSFQKENSPQEALATLARFHQQYSDSSLRDQAHFRAGEIHYGREAFSEAIRAYQQVIEGTPDSTFVPFALYGVGWSHMKLAQFPEASQSFQALLDRFPEHELSLSTQLAAGMALRQAGDYQQAIETLQRYMRADLTPAQRADALYERGLAEAADRQFDQAGATFLELLTVQPAYAHADKVRYELAWAYRSGNDPAAALHQFERLAQEFPDSPLAAEANFHLAESFYERQQFDRALPAFRLAQQHASLSELKEKATYKLGWTYFQLKEFTESARQFQDQAASFPDGVLYGDALFMWGESLFKQGDYEPALAAFQQARQSPASSGQMQVLTLLHAAQSASQLTRFPEAIELLDELENRFPANSYLPEAWYERGWARQKLDDLDKAFQEYERAAGPRNALGARARFMMGEVRFAQKKYDEAIREFQRAMYLYGGQEAPSDVKVWQAKAAYEAARCAEVQIESAPNANQRGAAIENAKKFYTYVVLNHGDDPLASEARKRLEVLRKL